MELFDTHCHLTDPKFTGDIDEVLAHAWESGVRAVLTVGTGLPDAEQAVRLSLHSSPVKIIVSGGLTPYDIYKGAGPDEIAGLKELLSGEDSVKAFGEIGLDRFHGYGDDENEERMFLLQLDAAEELGLPVILHCREAHERMRELLKPHADFLSGKTVVHCFSGTYEDASDYLDMGLFLSFTCAVGYRNSEEERTVLKKIPLESVMAETDSPYLPPADRRGSRNEPANVAEVLRIIAELKGIPEHRACEKVFENSLEFFRIRI